jgi:LysR family glycine cleavage system transcriptional activator
MNKSLPPLDHLRAFEAAARHLSFRRAAEELNVTPAAVSQRIRALEARLQIALFKRLTRAVILTDAGQKLATDVREGLSVIRRGLAALEADQRFNVLTISTTTTFAERWLLPHLPDFQSRCSDCDVRIVTTDERVNFETDAVDLAIRLGRGAYRGCHATPLLDELYYPVCIPELIGGAACLKRPEDLYDYTLIHTDWLVEQASAPTWEKWFESVGADPSGTTRRLYFSSESLTVRAALDGQGVALVNIAHVSEELARGHLVRPFGTELGLRSEFRYYVVWPKRTVPEFVDRFRNWVLAEFSDQTGFR